MLRRRKWLSLALLGSMLLGVLQPALVQAAAGFDYTKVPKLLITELVPDTSNIPELNPDGTPKGPKDTVDGYESIEIYNNTSQDIDFRDYKIVYNNGSDVDWLLNKKDEPVIIHSRESIVLWVLNGSNNNEPVNNFNANYTANGYVSNLVEGTNLFRINGGGGMANTGTRSVAIKSMSNVEIIKASYTVSKSNPNYGIHYSYPTDASKNMAMVGAPESQPASPGTVEAIQVPDYPSDYVTPPADTNLKFQHSAAVSVSVYQDVPINVTITGNLNTVTASVYYKTDTQANYSPIPMNSLDGSSYTASIPSQALVGGRLLQYYIEAADGNMPSEKSSTYVVAIDSKPPVQDNKLQIEHMPAKQVDPKDLLITAKLNNPDKVKIDKVELLYKSPSQAKYTVLTMKQLQTDGNDYSVTIPASAFVEPTLDYVIRVKDVEKSYTVSVNIPSFNAAKVPILLVTKIVPNTTNVPNTSSDAFEMIEVYNNTDAPINFKNYKVNYRYPDDGPEADLKWPATKEDFMIPSKQSVVFWIKNGVNNSYTAADFNSFYKTNLIEDTNLFVIKSDGMANSGRRGIVIKTNAGKEISYANYDATTVYEGGVSDETKEDKAILFKYPMDGSITMIKASSGIVTPVPGAIDSALVPSVPVHVVQDVAPPKAEDRSGILSIDQSQNLELKAFADDETQVATVKVFIRTDKESEYTGYALTQNFSDSLYHYLMPAATLIGSKYIEYYFMVSDGTNEVETTKVKVDITGKPGHDPLRLNVKNGDIVNGTKTLKGTSETASANTLKLSVDGQAITQNTFDALEHDAYFVFEAKGVDYYFKNAVTMGPESEKDKTILYTFMDPIPTYTTLTYKIDASRLHIGADNVIYIRAGSKTSPFDDRKEENKDDFEVRNVRLMLADGTEIWDPLYAKDNEIKIGDSPGKKEGIGFSFNLDAKYFQSHAYAWDTTTAADGAHQVKVTDSKNVVVTANVTVDNTPPSIKPNIEEGKQYRGSFKLDAEIKDQLAGVDKVIVKLDNQDIKLPYALSSGSMKAGNHTLTITASDKVGNQAERTVAFTTPEENPLKPELIAPTQGQSELGGSVGLKVKVQDPTNDPMNVTFYRGFQYDGNRAEGFKGFKNSSDTEPPKSMIPKGEEALSVEEYRKISAEDGDYLVNDAVEKFPYQRYEIQLDPAVQKTDRVDIVWKGKSIEGRKVSLYAWNEKKEKWVQLVTRIAGAEDFELKSTVQVEDYAMGQMIQIIVQDEIAELKDEQKSDKAQDPYDFSFVWMSDTQYYSQSYPKIYQKIVNWVKDNKESNKIKYVIHTGDIVDKSYQEYQWQEADLDMKVLEDAKIPYGVLAGNHDVGHQDNDYTKYWQYFGENRFKDMPTYGESYQNNRGHYDLVSAGGNDFIIVYMGWGLGDKEIDWMNEVVAKYPERKAILCLHEYMLVSNNRAPIADKIFEKVIKPNKNVIAALSGHYHDAQLKIDELDDNGVKRKVYQMLADYQGAPEGGLGYIRLMQFDMKNNKLHIKTYSPYLDDYNYYDPEFYPGKDEFSLDLDLQPATKRVATDYIGVKVYSDLPIGKVNNVQSGQQAAYTWNSLQGNSYYQWYTKVEDGNSGQVLSDIWGFYTGKVADPKPEPEPKPDPKPQPKPEPSSDKGVVNIKPGADGAYTADRAALEKAVNEAENGKVAIKLEGTASEQAAQLTLDAAGVQKAKDRKLSLEIVASGFTVTIPAASLPNGIADADRIVLQIDPTMNSTIQTAVKDALRSNGELKSTGVVFTLKLVTVKGKTETVVPQFSGPITVKRTLTAEQMKQLQKDYANMYRLVGGQAELIQSRFDGSTISFTTDQLAQFAALELHKQFADLTGGWADEYILKLAAKNIITGMDDNHFRPNLKVSRADFTTLVIRALEIQTAENNPAFADVAADAYYAGYVSKAAELGLVQGNDGKFRPKDQITREEAALVLVKMAQYMKKPMIETTSGAAFTDMNSISGWAKDAVSKLQAAGIINGKDDNRFDPRGSVTRAEIAKMLYMILNK